jgi:hypothetical protein
MALPLLNPWLLAALPAVGVPVLIHLLNRHRSVTIEWGAMELLRRVMVFRSRQIRLEDLLLMLLRCAVVLLVVLAVARPTTKWLSATRPDMGVVIALDGSLSMSHRPGLASRLDEAANRVREILKTIKPNWPVTLVELGSRPQVLLRNAGYDPTRFEQVLKELKPFDEPLNLEGCLAELEPLAAEIKAPRRELYLVTDAQTTTFRNLSEKARLALERLADTAQLLVLPVESAGQGNLAVTRLELASGVLRVGAIARFNAVVQNFGRAAQDAGELSLVLGDQVVDKRFVGQLAPGQAMPVRLYASLSRAGVLRMTAQLGDDALAADNSRYAVLNVRNMLRVLCVDGEPMDRSDTRATSLVMTALAPKTIDRSEALPDVERIAWTALPAARLADYDVVVLVNVADVPEDRAVALRKFVEQGGGLIVMAGNNVKPEVLGWRLTAPGSSLLPAELVSLVSQSGADVSGAALDLDLPDHPLVRPLRSLPKELLGEARFYRHLRVRLMPEGRTLLRLTGGEPILLVRPVGRGKVLLWTSGADLAWNNLAVNPALPMLMQQAVTYLSRQPFEEPVTVPQPIVLPLAGLATGREVGVSGPDGKQAVVRMGLRSGEVVAETDSTALPGFYDVHTDSQAPVATVAVNVNTAGSDVKVLGTEELTAAFAGLPIRVVAADRNVAAAVTELRIGRELWQLLVFAAIALLAIEALLARWYSRPNA